MVFSSTVFLFIFLPILLILYFLVRGKARNVILLVASLLFYAWGEPKTVFIMMLSIAVNFGFGFLVNRKWKYNKFFLVLSVVYNLGILFIFKYLNFTVDTINQVLNSSIHICEIALPIGISFYTFQIMSYVIDVYRGNCKPQKNILNLGLYISLFPQLIAGPIVRYVDVEKQIVSRTTSIEKVSDGFIRFCVGFAKKVLIADQLSSFVDIAFDGSYPSIITKWVGIIAYTLQIYFDFSGYSDMAIGLGKVFGFDFLENFDYPYISRSIQEFWRRWHISLSSWFRDYLYIPLGGNRKGQLRTYINLCIVFFMTGLWHGASFNFIVWGLFYAVFLVIERLGFNKVLEKLPKVIRHIYALLVIMIGWIFFRASTLTAAAQYILALVRPAGHDLANFNFAINKYYIFTIILGVLFSIPFPALKKYIDSHEGAKVVRDILVIIVFVLAIFSMVGSGYSPFLYFRF